MRACLRHASTHLWLSPRSSPPPGRHHHRRSRRSSPRSDFSALHPCEIAGTIRSAAAETHPAHSSTRKVKITSTCTRGARSGLRDTRHRRRSEASQGSQDPAPGPGDKPKSGERTPRAPKSGPFLFASFFTGVFKGQISMLRRQAQGVRPGIATGVAHGVMCQPSLGFVPTGMHHATPLERWQSPWARYRGSSDA